MKHIFSFAAILIFCACGPSIRLSDSWVPANVRHAKLNKIIVLVLAPQKYSVAGRTGEQSLAGELKANGIDAVSAADEYGPLKFRNNTEQDAIEKMRKSGADAVIVTSLLDVEKEKRYVPGAAFPPPYYGRFWGYYSFWYNRAYDQGYYETTRKYYLETNLYDLSGGQLLYSVQSQTMDPGSADRLAHSFSKLVVKDMKRRQVI